MKKKHSFFIMQIIKKFKNILLKICLDKKLIANRRLIGINYFKKKISFSLLKEKKKINILKTSLIFFKKKIRSVLLKKTTRVLLKKTMRVLLKKKNKYKNKKMFKPEIAFSSLYEEISISQPFNLKFFFFSKYFIGSSYYLNSFATLERFQIQLKVYKEIFKNDFKILVAGNEQQKKLSKIISNTLSKNKRQQKKYKT